MTHTRMDIGKLPAGWNDTMLWYAKAVGEMQKRPVTDPTSWRFLGAMHGIWPQLWTAFGILKAGEALPTNAVQARFWKQCQHQSWYFLPWHRGYLAAFETIVRETIRGLGGNAPADAWALPYWNYDTAHKPSLALPAVFADAKLPDGSPNPLFVARRYGHGPGKIALRVAEAKTSVTLAYGHFPGGDDGVPPGFGGPQGQFHHGDENDQAPSGGLESQPHNNVHVAVGGQKPGANPQDPTALGLMTNPDTAALDPVFWVHHANIDRLWASWLSNPAHKNPTDKAWLKGPADRVFAMPKPGGGEFTFAPKDMLDTTTPLLNYTYQALVGGAVQASRRLARLATLSAALPAAAAFTGATAVQMANSEVIGQNDGPVRLAEAPVDTVVRLDGAGTAKVAASFAPAAGSAEPEPDRVFLRLENIRSASDAGLFDVFVNLPTGADPEQHPELLAGVLSLFGVSKASRTDGGRSGNGLTQVMEITAIVDALHLQAGGAGAALDRLTVRFVPQTEVTAEHKVSVGAVRVLRLSA